MSSSISLARRAKPRWPIWLLVVLLSIIPAGLFGTLQAQTPPQEISSHDVEPGFTLKTERNMVMVRVVVHGAKGAVVENLHKEDFKLFDRGKAQTVVSFSMEKPALKVSIASEPKSADKTATEPADENEANVPAAMARRFVGMYFDDVNTPFEDMVRTRDAADRFVTSSIQPGDRVGLFTSSGLKQVDFTSDVAQIHQALLGLRSRPIAPPDSCDSLPPYLAYLVTERNDGLTAAAYHIATCDCQGSAINNSPCFQMAQNRVLAEAQRTQSFNEAQVTAALRGIESLVRRMTTLPGQRSVMIVSSGFLAISPSYLDQLDQITDRALRAGVPINAIDARGLYTDVIADASLGGPQFSQSDLPFLQEGARRQAEAIRNLAHDTGGIFFENSNDLDAGLRKTAAVPEAFYVLTFSPQNLRHDGAFHEIKVSLVAPKGLTVQARRGYFAPKKSEDAASQEKEEIREAVFSREESHDLPIDVHTQFFMASETDARLTVLARLDLRPLHFRKEVDRNFDKLTLATVIFDLDGHVVSAQQKVLELQMHDAVLEKYQQSGITLKSEFDLKPGTYMVRTVLRDSESGQIAGLNRTVEIPY
jgi:VWFA-related protein